MKRRKRKKERKTDRKKERKNHKNKWIKIREWKRLRSGEKNYGALIEQSLEKERKKKKEWKKESYRQIDKRP
jgi:hypothetical protein